MTSSTRRMMGSSSVWMVSPCVRRRVMLETSLVPARVQISRDVQWLSDEGRKGGDGPVDVLEETLGVRPEAHDELRDLLFLHFMQQRRVPGVDLPEEDLAVLPMARAVRQQRRVQSIPRSTQHHTHQVRLRNGYRQRSGFGDEEGGGSYRSPTIGIRGLSE